MGEEQRRCKDCLKYDFLEKNIQVEAEKDRKTWEMKVHNSELGKINNLETRNKLQDFSLINSMIYKT